MFFLENTNNEYFIETEYGWYTDEKFSDKIVTTKLFSLNEKKRKDNFYKYPRILGGYKKDI